MTYVTLRPHSITNETDKHLVVEFQAWRDYVDGNARMFLPHSKHDTAREAQVHADSLNAGELCRYGCRAAADELSRRGQEMET